MTFEMLGDRDVAVITVAGRIRLGDVARALDFGIRTLGRPTCHLVVDFSRAAHFDEFGIGLLAYTKKVFSKRGYRMAVVRPKDASVVEELPEDLGTLFRAFDTLDEAVDAVRTGG